MSTLELGQKIKHYRQRSKYSQFELEYKIEASPGSISRIENGQINPTKETLSKIANAFELKPSEIADLLGVKIFSPEELVSAINKISKCFDLETTLQTAVDIIFDLYPDYNGGVLLLVDQNNPDLIWSQTVSNMPNIEKVHKLLPRKLNQFSLSRSKNLSNFIVQCVNQRIILQSFDLVDFGREIIPDIIVTTVGKILNFQSGIVLPMIYEDEVIGAVIYTKRVKEKFDEDEERILKLLNEQLAITIVKVRRI